MGQTLVLKAKGLFTNVNELSEIPEGGMTVCNNVFVDRDGIVESRRGFSKLTYSFFNTNHRARSLFEYKDKLLAHYGVTNSEQYLAYYDDTVTTLQGTTTNASAIVTAISSTASLRAGMAVSGTGIPSNTYISTVDSATQITLTQNATASGSPNLDFSGWRNYTGTFLVPDSSLGRIRGLTANSNFYFNTSSGVKRLDQIAGIIVNAGGIKALEGTGVTTGVSGFMNDDTQVAYRVVWGFKDANNNLILGTPSSRIIVINSTGGSRDVSLTINIPSGVTTDHFYQIYRSGMSATAADEPNDEMNLVLEANPTSAEITAKQFTVTDSTPEDLRSGATLYTSPSQEGILQSNEPPPFAKDIALFKESVFFGNIKSAHRMFLTLLAVGGTNGLNYTATTGDITNTSPIITNIPSTTGLKVGQLLSGTGIPANAAILTVDGPTQITMTVNATATTVGVALEFYDKITLAGTEYFTAAAEDVANRKFQVYTGGTPGQNIDNTARSFVKIINTNTTNTTVYAYYISGFADLPGKILIEERVVGGSTFYATSTSHGSAWNPSLPTSGTSVASANDEFKNGLMFSKTQQPEAVPTTNIIRVGTAEKAILRIIPLREALFILKEDGVFRLTGTGPGDFRVDLLDNTTTLIAPDSAVPLNNQIYMLADQGVATVSDTGVSVVSRPVEIDFLRLFSKTLSTVKTLSAGIAYESERKYILNIVSDEEDEVPTQCYTYNTFTNAWTKWLLSKRCGIVLSTDGRLYLADADSNVVNVERKNRDYTDFIEDEYEIEITAIDGKLLTLNGAPDVEIGDLVYQSELIASNIVEIDTANPAATVITVEDTLAWTVGVKQAFKAIPVEIEYAPQIGKNPGGQKHFKEIALMFKELFFSRLKINFTSEVSRAEETVNFSGFRVGFWGLFPWGSGPWGGQKLAASIRTYVPARKQRCSQLTINITHREAYSFFVSNGLSVVYDVISTRIAR